MSKKNISLKMVILILAIVFFTQCAVKNNEVQTQTVSNSVGASIPRPADEAKIEINAPEYEIRETSVEYLQSLPMPEIKFVFESKNVGTNEMSEEVKTILNNYWKEAIKYWHTDTFDKAKGQTGYNRDVAFLSYNNKTENKLKELFIESPNGRREISFTEARKLWSSLNQASIKVLEKAESVK